MIQEITKAKQDVIEGFQAHNIWRMLAWRELRSQYDRTILGILWITVSPLLHIVIIGSIFYVILNEPINYLTYFSTSWVIWTLIRHAVGDSSTLWLRASTYVTNMKLPLSLFFFSTALKNFITCAMILQIAIIAMILFGGSVNIISMTLLLPGFILFYLNLFWSIIVLSTLCLRFRDLVGLIPHALFILQFVTPIFWPVERLGNHLWIAYLNPFYHLIEITRGPLIGITPEGISWIVTIVFALLGNTAAFILFFLTRRRLVLWML
jgi:ABC-2 type transport system permease protein